MAEVPDNADEQLYETDDFEDEPADDAVSEAEDEVEEQLEEQLEEQDAETESSQSDESEYSDTETESDIEAEFSRCNPCDREHFYGRMLSGRSSAFNREIKKYSSSSSDEDGNGVVTKTVAEINVYASDEDAASGRTLVPHDTAKTEDDNDELEEELEENDVNNDLKGDDEDYVVQVYDNDDDNRSLEAEEVEEEQQEEMDDNEMGQLIEEQESEDDDNHNANKIYAGAYVEDAEDSSDSWRIEYTNMGQQVQLEKPEQTISHFEEKQDMINAEEEPIDNKTETLMEPQLRQTDAAQITETQTMETETMSLSDSVSEEDDDFDESNTNVANQTLDALNADAAAVKYLELQMNQMSEMIKKTFRITSGANEQVTAKPNPTQFVGHTLPKLAEEELETSMGESEFTDNQSHCDISEFSLELQEDSVATMTTVRTSRLKCRCPTEIADVKATFMMDECGQGDGLMRHPHSHHHHHHDIDCHVSNVRPGSFNSEQAFHVNLNRPQSSKEKVNYKNLGRKSFSFTNAQVRDIERQNQILLKKMMTIKPTIKANVNKTNSQINVKNQPQTSSTRTSSAAINRKKFQRKIDEENNLLKRKLEAIGSRRSQFK